MSPARALVTDAEERSAVAAIRGLAQAGYEVTATSSQRPAAGLWSRAVKRRLRLPDAREDEFGFVDGLEDALRRERNDLCLFGTEVSMLAASAHRDRLEPLTPLGLPPHEIVERSLDKIALIEAAAANGLAPPEGIVSGDGRELDDAVGSFGFPIVVKPQRSLVSRDNVLGHRGAVLVYDSEELERTVARFGFPVIAQRPKLAASVYSCGGVYAGGRLLALSFARYSRTWPAEAGSASYAETQPLDPGLTERVTGLIGEIGWEGIFELELLRLEDGRFAAIDLNPRVYGSLSLAVKAGANLPAIWCDWVKTGEAPNGVVATRPGVRYRFEDAELRNFVSMVVQARLGEALGIARPRRQVAHAYFLWGDPGPLVARAIELVKHAGSSGRRTGDRPRQSWASRGQMPRTGKAGEVVAGGTQFLLAYLVALPFVLLVRLLRTIKWRILGRGSAKVVPGSDRG